MLSKERTVYGLCHLAFWFPLTFASPLFVGLENYSDIQISFLQLFLSLSVLTLAVTSLTALISAFLGGKVHRIISLILLSLGMALVLQGNIISDLFYYGEFNGEQTTFRDYGVLFWLELLFFLKVPMGKLHLETRNGLLKSSGFYSYNTGIRDMIMGFSGYGEKGYSNWKR